MNDADEEYIIDQSQDTKIKEKKKKQKTGSVSTFWPLTERTPLRMHSFRPVPRTITSYSSSIAELQLHRTTSRDPNEMNSRESKNTELVQGSLPESFC